VFKVIAVSSAFIIALLSTVLFFPPVRDWVFSNNLWPWPLSSDITAQQTQQMSSLAKPGDIIVESNMHFWQWVALCEVFTHTTWVHASLVDDCHDMITMEGTVKELPLSAYERWHSTRVALIRPTYKSPAQVEATITYARKQISTPYDPSFRNLNASCTGVVAEALRSGGIQVTPIELFGRRIFPADAFFHIGGAHVLWSSNQARL
jgi:hypothetical protein